MALASWQFRPARHVGVVRRADEFKDAHALVYVRFAFEDGFALEHFAEDAAHAPHVYRGRVTFQREEQLWWTVPAGYDEAGVVADCVAVPFTRLRCLALVVACEAEIGDLEQATVGD